MPSNSVWQTLEQVEGSLNFILKLIEQLGRRATLDDCAAEYIEVLSEQAYLLKKLVGQLQHGYK